MENPEIELQQPVADLESGGLAATDVNVPVEPDEKDYKLENTKNKFNAYATNKSISQTMLNTTVIQYNIGLFLFTFYGSGNHLNNYEIALVVLLSASMFIEVIIFIFLAFLIMVRQDSKTSLCSRTMFKAKHANFLVTLLSGFAWMTNIAITYVYSQVKTIRESQM
mgnify:FL=1